MGVARTAGAEWSLQQSIQMLPQTRYAKSGEVSIAYQVFGSGSRDLLYVPGWASNIDLFWEEPSYAGC